MPPEKSTEQKLTEMTKSLQMQDKLRRRTEEAEALLQVSREISSTLSLSDILEIVYRQASRIIDTTGFYVALYDRGSNDITIELSIDQGQRFPKTKLPQGKGITWWIVQTGKALLVKDGSVEKFPVDPVLSGTEQVPMSMLAVPMMLRDKIVGVLSAQSYQKNAFTEQQLRLLSIFANQAAIAIENARLFTETQQRLNELTALYQTSQALTSTLDLHTTLQLIAKEAKILADADTCIIFETDEGTQTLYPRVVIDPKFAAEIKAAPPLKIGEGVSGWVAKTGVGEIVNQSHKDPRAAQVPGTPVEEESLISVPLIVKGKTIGVITLSKWGSKVFYDRDLRLLSTFANQAAIAMENARLFQKVQETAKVFEKEAQELRQRLEIVASREPVASGELKFSLRPKTAYLVEEGKPGTSYAVFKDQVTHGLYGLVVTRQHPERIRKRYDLEKTPIIWLSSTPGENFVNPINIGLLLDALKRFIEKNPNSVVLIDGVELLITNNDFPSALRFLDRLNEIVMQHDTRLLVSIDPRTLGPKELALLERNMEVISEETMLRPGGTANAAT